MIWAFLFRLSTWAHAVVSYILSLVGLVPRYPVQTKGVILITGCSTGIGEDAAFQLATVGYHVFAGVRKPEDYNRLLSDGKDGLRKLGRGRIIPIILDITLPEHIHQAEDNVRTYCTANRLPFVALVNNAGVVVGAEPVEVLEEREVRRVFEVNLFGTMAVTRAFLPLVRACRARIVFVSSIAAIIPTPCMGHYAASKAALDSFAATLRVELHPFKVAIAIVRPGAIRTAVWDKLRPFRRAVKENVYTPLTKAFDNRAGLLERTRQTPRRTTTVALVHAVTARFPNAVYTPGLDSLAIAAGRLAVGDVTLSQLAGFALFW